MFLTDFTLFVYLFIYFYELQESKCSGGSTKDRSADPTRFLFDFGCVRMARSGEFWLLVIHVLIMVGDCNVLIMVGDCNCEQRTGAVTFTMLLSFRKQKWMRIFNNISLTVFWRFMSERNMFFPAMMSWNVHDCLF